MEKTTVAHAVQYRIKKLCQINNLSINQLSKRSGITQSTINEIMNGGTRDPRLSTLVKIATGFGITIQEFLDDPIFDGVDW